MQAALSAGVYIPRLCYHPEFKPHGSCKLCTIKTNGCQTASCTQLAQSGVVVESNTQELNDERRALLQMLFVEGNHFCPSCEQSGNCQLQATAYALKMMSSHYEHFFPDRPLDASHHEYLLDFNRCILCSLCIHASREVDGKNVFGLAGRGINTHLIVNAESGQLADTDFSGDDKAAHVCPVGVIIKKRKGFEIPIGQRTYDLKQISAMPDSKELRKWKSIVKRSNVDWVWRAPTSTTEIDDDRCRRGRRRAQAVLRIIES